jgi:hypothetical protein
MLPVNGSNPKINILYIGAYILKKLNNQTHKSMKILDLFRILTRELSISIDHIILALDWLYMISAIDGNKKEVYINETN